MCVYVYDIQVEQLTAFLEEMKGKKKFVPTANFVPEGGITMNSHKGSVNGNQPKPGEKESANQRTGAEGDELQPPKGIQAQGGGGSTGNLQGLANAAHGADGGDENDRAMVKGDAMSFKKRIIRIKQPQASVDASPAHDCR